MPRPAGRERGGGGFPAPPRKMIKTAGKLWGKIEVRLSIFSNRGPMMEQITTLNDAQLPIPALKTGYVRDTILYTLFNPILFLWIIVEGK